MLGLRWTLEIWSVRTEEGITILNPAAFYDGDTKSPDTGQQGRERDQYH